MSNFQRTKKSLPYTAALSLFNVLVGLFGMVYLVGYLEADVYGVLVLLMGLPVFINLYASMGYNLLLGRYLPSIESHQEIRHFFWRTFLERMGISVLICGALVAAFPLFDTNFGVEGYAREFAVYQIAVVAQIAMIFLNVALNSLYQQKALFILGIVPQFLRFGAIYIGVVLEQDLMFFILLFAGLHVVSMLGSMGFLIYRYGFPSFRDLRSYREEKEQRKFRRMSYVNEIGASFISTNLDRYLLAYFATNVQVAIYAVATSIMKKVLTFLPQKMLKPLLEPSMYSKYDASGNADALNRMAQFVLIANWMVTLAFIAIFLPVGRELLPAVLTKDYVIHAYEPLLLFLISLLINSMPFGIVAKAILKPQILLVAKVASLVNLALGIPMTYYYGALGMAAATVFSIFLRATISYFLIRKNIAIHFPWKGMLRGTLNTTAVVLVLYAAGTYVDLHLLLRIGLGGAAYVLLNKFNPMFTAEQRKLFLDLVPNRLKPAFAVIL